MISSEFDRRTMMAGGEIRSLLQRPRSEWMSALAVGMKISLPVVEK